MNDVTVIDRFLDTFSRYIDSGFGLLHGEVAFLTATLIVIDMTLAGLFWAMGHTFGGRGRDRQADPQGAVRRRLRLHHRQLQLAGRHRVPFIRGPRPDGQRSTLSMENFLQPGRLAKVGIDAGAPILKQIGDMAGFPEVFVNITPIVVMFLAWLIVLLCFFVLAIQLFITLIEFKLTTLAGFVLVPFALWNKTAFLAEGAGQRGVLGHQGAGVGGHRGHRLGVVCRVSGTASRAIHRPLRGRDAGLADTAGLGHLWAGHCDRPGVRRAAARRGRDGRCRAGCGRRCRCRGRCGHGRRRCSRRRARMAPAAAKLAGSGARAATGAATSARSAFQAGSASAGGGLKGAAAGVGNVAKTGAQAAGQKVADGARSMKERVAAAFRPDGDGSTSGAGAGAQTRPPHRPRPPNNPGPSACIAGSNSPTPRPRPPIRYAAAMPAAPAQGQACVIPIHKENFHAIQRPQVRYADTPQPATRTNPRTGLGRAHWLGPRAGEELALHGIRLPHLGRADGGRRSGARRSPSSRPTSSR